MTSKNSLLLVDADRQVFESMANWPQEQEHPMDMMSGRVKALAAVDRIRQLVGDLAEEPCHDARHASAN